MYMSGKNKILTKKAFNYWWKKISYSLIQHTRKSMRIEVSPQMEVIVKAPLVSKQEQITQKMLKKASWIIRQLAYFQDFYPKITPRKYISWETFFYLWRQYILKIVKVKKIEGIKLIGKNMIVNITKKLNAQKIIDQRYLERAKEKFETYAKDILLKFEQQHKVTPNSVKVRRMQTRRWSCSKMWNITLNSELVRAPRGCIEYVIIHECCHMVEFWHTKAFYDLQAKKMPDRKKWKNKLENLLA